MWGVGLFGNITVTNQLNYTTMKNSVEASMMDSLDVAHYRAGLCICSTKAKKDGKWQLTDDKEYQLLDITYDEDGNEKCVPEISGSTCDLMLDEFRVKPRTFSESLVRRFVTMVNNNKSYEVTIQDVIEYPPKVSVRFVSHDEDYSPTEKNSGGYDVLNQTDAIIETWGPVPTPVATAPPQVTPPDYRPSGPSSSSCSSCGGETERIGCFLPGTKIAVVGGYKDIDQLKIGDYVLTYNEKKKENEYKKINKVFIYDNIDEVLYTIKIDNIEMKLTGHHRVYTYRNGEYVYIAVQDLNVGDDVMYSNGEFHKIIEIKHEKIKKTVYNLSIEDNNNFYVGEQEILVHNNAIAGVK